MAEHPIDPMPQDPMPQNGHQSRRLAWPVRLFLVACLFSLLAFGLLYSLRIVTTPPPLAFLQTSRELASDPLIRQLIPAVVDIEATAEGTQPWRGTGFNIDPSGVIVTNRHVVDEAESVWIHFRDHGTFEADKWTLHPEEDLAVIQLAGPENLPFVEPAWGQSRPRRGTHVYVIGNPLGYTFTTTSGTIRGYGTATDAAGQPMFVMEIEAPIYVGSSGSPVFDTQGRVVGVVFAQLATDRGGLAVPIAALTTLLQAD